MPACGTGIEDFGILRDFRREYHCAFKSAKVYPDQLEVFVGDTYQTLRKVRDGSWEVTSAVRFTSSGGGIANVVINSYPEDFFHLADTHKAASICKANSLLPKQSTEIATQKLVSYTINDRQQYGQLEAVQEIHCKSYLWYRNLPLNSSLKRALNI